MNRIGQIFCMCMLGFIFSCDSDSSFDEDNRILQVEGVWEAISIESNSYSSTMTSPTGQSDTSTGSFEGDDIDISLIFEADGTFRTSGDYNQVLTIQGSFPTPFTIESRTNDFEGGGAWEITGDILSMRTSADVEFQQARLNVLTDTEMDFDYNYTRVIVEGTVSRVVAVQVNYIFEKR